MAANCAGIAGSQVFRTADAPLYLNAFTVCLALNAVAVVEIIVQTTWYFFSNRKLAKAKDAGPMVVGDTETTPDGHRVELVRKWWWTW